MAAKVSGHISWCGRQDTGTIQRIPRPGQRRVENRDQTIPAWGLELPYLFQRLLVAVPSAVTLYCVQNGAKSPVLKKTALDADDKCSNSMNHKLFRFEPLLTQISRICLLSKLDPMFYSRAAPTEDTKSLRSRDTDAPNWGEQCGNKSLRRTRHWSRQKSY